MIQTESEMLTFRVDDMTCGHCVRAIKDAVRALDAEAAVDVDLPRRLVRVHAAHLEGPRVRQALEEAGYFPCDVVPRKETPTSAAGGCGCSSVRCGCAD